MPDRDGDVLKPELARIDPRASRYLELLVEFGHLDARDAQEILFDAMEGYADSKSAIPLHVIQRLAAHRLVRWDSPTPGGKDILSADWPLLFQ